jgi:catechol 2,3-dioxygenase-like lactoylglutathione lyase family enzyme
MNQAIEFLHTAYLTRDMDSSIRAWQDALGAAVELPRTRIAADNVDVCILTFKGFRIELVQPCDAERASRVVQEAKGHPDHICLLCDNLDERVAHARDQGALVVRPPIHSEAFGRRMCFILYPGIGLIEWVEK